LIVATTAALFGGVKATNGVSAAKTVGGRNRVANVDPRPETHPSCSVRVHRQPASAPHCGEPLDDMVNIVRWADYASF